MSDNRSIVKAIKNTIKRELSKEVGEARGVVITTTPGIALVRVNGASTLQQAAIPPGIVVEPDDSVDLTANNQSSRIRWIVSKSYTRASFNSSTPLEQQYDSLFPPDNIREENSVPGAITIVWDSTVSKIPLTVEVETSDDDGEVGTKILQNNGNTAIIPTNEPLYVRCRTIAPSGATSSYSNWLLAEPLPITQGVSQALLTFEGSLDIAENPLRIYNVTGDFRTIQKIFLSASIGPTGDDIIIDVKIDGVSIFSSSPNPTILDGQETGFVTTFDDDNWPDGSYITAEIIQIGSTITGSNLSVHIVY